MYSIFRNSTIDQSLADVSRLFPVLWHYPGKDNQDMVHLQQASCPLCDKISKLPSQCILRLVVSSKSHGLSFTSVVEKENILHRPFSGGKANGFNSMGVQDIGKKRGTVSRTIFGGNFPSCPLENPVSVHV